MEQNRITQQMRSVVRRTLAKGTRQKGAACAGTSRVCARGGKTKKSTRGAAAEGGGRGGKQAEADRRRSESNRC
eukprot:15442053-Alexandrium_andersonii.AAC.1